jgi:hypothetical protein
MMPEREQSEFNMAVSYLGRLNALLYLCDDAMTSLDINDWFHILIAIESEISTEMSVDELKTFEDRISDINRKIDETMNRKGRVSTGAIPPDLFALLHNFEIDLRRILKSSGLQMKMKQDAGKSLM